MVLLCAIHKLAYEDTGKVVYDGLAFKFLELPNFGKVINELKSDLDRWFYILKNMSQMEKIPLYLNKGIFEKLFKIAKLSKLTEEQRKIYESNLKAERDYESTIAFARKEEGKKARELGREEGIELGRLKEKLATALELKETGWSVDQISKITKLSIDEIEKL